MQTKVVKLDPNRPDIVKIKAAAALVDTGGLVAFPTETVYGIACRVATESLTRLSEVKGRDAEKSAERRKTDSGRASLHNRTVATSRPCGSSLGNAAQDRP